MTIEEFCKKHNACVEGYTWAITNCSSMQEAWDKCPKANWLIWIATRPNVLDDRTLRLFAVWCCRQVQYLMIDKRSIAAVDAAEQFANDLISRKQLTEKRKEASNAADAAAADAAASAAAAAAVAAYAASAAAASAAAAADAAYVAAADAAYVAAAAAADAAYAAAAYVATHKSTQQAQITYLRQNCKPNFS